MVPSEYKINVAKQDGLNWRGEPNYKWFCTISAGNWLDHAKQVEQTVKEAFPAPEYSVTLSQRYEFGKPVEHFGE